MNTIELPERMVRIQGGTVPENRTDVNSLFEKIYEHEKNYYK